MKKLLSLFLSIVCLISSFSITNSLAYSKTISSPNELITAQAQVNSVDTSASLSHFVEFTNKLAEGAYIIPGLGRTVTFNTDEDYVTIDSMIPQGICRMGEYTLITAYDGDDICKSVIYVLDSSYYLVKTLILPDKYHVGGIAYDNVNQMILITKSSKKCLAGITYTDFEGYMNSASPFVRVDYSVIETTSDVKPPTAAGVTFHNGYVFISSFNTGSSSCFMCYTPVYNAELDTYDLKYNYKVSVPNYTQGVTIYDYKEQTRLFVTVSYGRSEKKPVYESYLYTYDFDEQKGTKSLDNVLACPPMLEQTYCVGGKLFCLFETASKLYRSVNADPIDLVVPIKLSKLCDEKKGSVINVGYTKVNDGKRVGITSSIPDAKIYYSTGGSIPYINNKSVYGASNFEPYVKTVSSSVYAVAVVDGRIIAADYLYITVDKAPAPSKLVKKATTKSSATISWKKSSSATGYYIYRADSKKGSFKKIATVASSKSSYKDTKLKKNKTYYYKVKAYKKGYENSSFTNSLAIKTKKS